VNYIDALLNSLQHPFFMTIGGMVFWFLLKWSILRNKKGTEYNFINDQKDEIIVTLFGCLLFLIWDDEIINAYYDVVLKQAKHEHELKPYYYLIIGFAVERLYQIYEKITH